MLINPHVYYIIFYQLCIYFEDENIIRKGGRIWRIKIKENGMKNGGIVGFLYIILVYIIGGLISGNFSLTSNVITTIIFNILLGMIGGIVGVNLTNK